VSTQLTIRRVMFVLGLMVLGAPLAAAQSWTPPIGIPAPAFGVTQQAPADPNPWVVQVTGFYYVCPTCSGATDSGNSNGYPTRPRQTIPSTVPAGSVVRLRGVYDREHTGGWTPGTASAPVWIRGTPSDRPTVRRLWEFASGSSYTIVENIVFAPQSSSASFEQSGSLAINGGAHHVVVRDNQLSGTPNTKAGRITHGNGQYNVIFRNNISNVGNPNDTGDQDAHPIPVSGGSEIWILENTVTRYSGSGILLSGGANNNDGLHHVYVGRNHVYDGKQTGIGVKQATDAIISENTLHGFRTSSSSGGACSISQYGPHRLWYVANTIYDCEQGIEQASINGLGDGTELYIVGNTLYNIRDACINLFSASVPNRHVVGNTCVGATTGVDYPGTNGTLQIVNNIIANTSDVQIRVEGNSPANSSGTSARNNVFGGTFRVRWAGTTYTSLSAWQNATAHGDNSVTADPRFVDAAGMNFRLQAGSPAIDTGAADPDGVYSTFQTLYGRSIAGSRAGGGWDIGAYEYGGEASTPLPTVQISGSPTALPAGGGTTTISWQVANATSATINGTSVGASGSSPQTIASTTTYTLVAIGAGGTASASVTITVAGGGGGNPVNCVLSAWALQSATQWGACTNGQQSRTETWGRTVVTPASGGGAACGPLQEQRVATQACGQTAPVPSGAPRAPTNLTARVSGKTATLSWARPTTGAAPTSYQISVGTTSGASNVADRSSVGNVLSVSGQVPNGRYYVRVRAVNASGAGPFSNEASFTVGTVSRPRRPAALTGSLTGSTATLSWRVPVTDGADTPTGYLIEAGTAYGLSNLARVIVNDVTQFSANVPPGVYFVRVRAVNQSGASDPSNEVVLQPGGGSGKPAGLAAVGQGNNVSLSWRPPSSGDAPVGYVLEAGSAPGLADLVVKQLPNQTSFSTTAPPGVYYVRVRATNGVGPGEPSNEIVVRK
jgi:hypothetical protein